MRAIAGAIVPTLTFASRKFFKRVVVMSKARNFWSQLAIVGTYKVKTYLANLSPLYSFALAILGLSISGWLICSGVAELWTFFWKEFVPFYREIASASSPSI